jgi:L-aspartate oxidase
VTEDHPRYLVEFDTFHLPHHLTDVLVVGTGVAGYRAALAVARRGQRVIQLAKGDPAESNTGYAQGGVAAVLGGGADSPALHAKDTLEVGQGLCDERLVQRVMEAGGDAVRELMALGAKFDVDRGDPELGLEGGHSAPRILHARGDRTGAEIRDTLAAAARGEDLIEIWRDAFLVDLLTDDAGACRGALVYSRGRLRAIWAGAVVLATGGYAQIYRESTNVAGATGDGIAAAWRAGARLADLEFVQFHPTTLYLAGVPRLLLTEAIRGEGAHIVDDKGHRFLSDVLARGELAPRDEVSQAIMRHLERPDVGGVFLELSHLDGDRVSRRFPGVAASCRAHGLDLANDRIPIRPAAHYSIGGVRTDAAGATNVPGLYAAGEAANSGLHGANRLASNSLLEGLVVGAWAGDVAGEYASHRGAAAIALAGKGTGSSDGYMDEDDLRVSLKALMWREVGIQRQGGNLTGALGAVRAWEGFALRVGRERTARLSLLNMLLVSRLVADAAFRREESRGTHYRRDFPKRNDDRWRVRLVHERGREMVPLDASERPVPAVGAEGDRA